jgi:hypothetical protein
MGEVTLDIISYLIFHYEDHTNGVTKLLEWVFTGVAIAATIGLIILVEDIRPEN